MYQLEKYLVEDFIKVLPTSPFANNGRVRYSTEFNYSRGRTDIVIINEKQEIIAIEAKLTRWRYALHQAYRNTCFAHYSYILVPEEIFTNAEKHINEFKRRSIGICHLASKDIEIAFKAKKCKPVQNWLSNKVIDYVTNGGTND